MSSITYTTKRSFGLEESVVISTWFQPLDEGDTRPPSQRVRLKCTVTSDRFDLDELEKFEILRLDDESTEVIDDLTRTVDEFAALYYATGLGAAQIEEVMLKQIERGVPHTPVSVTLKNTANQEITRNPDGLTLFGVEGWGWKSGALKFARSLHYLDE
jgi:hypothetical protein